MSEQISNNLEEEEKIPFIEKLIKESSAENKQDFISKYVEPVIIKMVDEIEALKGLAGIKIQDIRININNKGTSVYFQIPQNANITNEQKVSADVILLKDEAIKFITALEEKIAEEK